MERRTPRHPIHQAHALLLLVLVAAAALGSPCGVVAFGVQPHQRTGEIVSTRLQSTYDPNYYYNAQKDFSPTGNSKYPMIPDHIKACSDLTDQVRREQGPPPQNRAQISTSIKACSDLTDQVRREQGPPPQNRAQISTSIKACSDLTDELRALNGPPPVFRSTLSREIVGASTLRDTRAAGHNGLTPVRSTVSREVVGASALRDDLLSRNNFAAAAAAAAAPAVAAVVAAAPRPDVFLSEAERNVMIRDYPQRAATEIPPPPQGFVPDEQGPPVASAVPQEAVAA